MKILILFSFIAFTLTAHAKTQEERLAHCRQQMHSKANMYVEDVEYCQNLMMKDSIEKFNDFSNRGPVVDCPEASEASDLVNACRSVGVKKVQEQGRAMGFTIRPQDVSVCEVDNSHWVFSNYVWFCANTPKGEIKKLTQKPRFKDCF